MNALKNSFFIGLTAVAMSAASGVYAQTSTINPNTATSTTAKHEANHPHAIHEDMTAQRQLMFQKHQKALHDELKLNSTQEPAWKVFSDSITPSPKPDMAAKAESENLTAPARMEKMMERMKDHQTKMQKHLDALKTFYATLTNEQQKIMDTHAKNVGKHMKLRPHSMQGMHQ